MLTLKQIDRQLNFWNRKINIVSSLKPTNLWQEKKRFSHSSVYQPIFHYPRSNFNLAAVLKQIKGLAIPGQPAFQLFARKRQSLGLACLLLKNIGRDKFSWYSQKLFGQPAKKDLILARAKITIPAKPSQAARFTADHLAQAMQANLAFYPFVWKIKTVPNLVARINVRPDRRTVQIRQGLKLTLKQIKAVVGHELSHILRFENGARQPFFMLKRGTADYLATEEGLAIFNEKKQAQLKAWPQRIYLRVLAAAQAKHSGFRQTFNKLLALGLQPDPAWNLTVRVKRGLTDTSWPGSFNKDWLYFKGQQQISSYLKKGGNLNQLYLGKINCRQLTAVQNLPRLKPALFLPRKIFINPKLK